MAMLNFCIQQLEKDIADHERVHAMEKGGGDVRAELGGQVALIDRAEGELKSIEPRAELRVLRDVAFGQLTCEESQQASFRVPIHRLGAEADVVLTLTLI